MSTPEERAHQEWIGYLQPAGLVVSPPALVKAQVIAASKVAREQAELVARVEPFGDDEVASLSWGGGAEPPRNAPPIPDVRGFLRGVLDWRDDDLVDPPESLEVVLPAYQDTLRPTFAVPDHENGGAAAGKWLMLVQVLPVATKLDRALDDAIDGPGTGWRASPQERFERLLREVGVLAGLLVNGTHIRLVYAPKGETSGHLTFPVQAMTEVGGRPILAGMVCLLGAERVFSPDKGRRLVDLLAESRKYQATVSNALAGQVLGALHELLHGVEAADQASGGRILRTVVPEHHDHLYAGLVTVLMRLVFLLYAEDRELMPRDDVYAKHYSVGGLYERLRADAGLYPDTMDQRYGAWAHLLALFRLVHDGGKHAGLSLPARHGDLFNPDSYPFLEGRPFGVARVLGETFEAPRVSDGVVWRVLQSLLMLNEERLSYRTLDVEQIGSVYEAIMGFGVERAHGPSIGVKPKNIVVNLDTLLARKGSDRAKWLAEEAEAKLPAGVAADLARAQTPEDVVAALGKSRVSTYTPGVLPKGSLYLQPGEERRRSGSHYTPRELTSPIVRTTLRPVLEALGERPTPEQILSLKVCDPAMGSGAFLVEACRQLAEKLVEAWELHGRLPKIPPDEEPYLHARRLVAQRCLYGVDKNPMAASLAKLSLWLVTLARDHAFTFLDHALKHGDALVGFTRQQIFAFNWNVTGNIADTPMFRALSANLGKAKVEREHIQRAGEGQEVEVREAFDAAEEALADARRKGDLLVAAFFNAAKPKEREALRKEYAALWDEAMRPDGLAAREKIEDIVAALRTGERPVPAFHWEVEFPEVFDRGNAGFDCFVGNPPFLGGTMIGGHVGLMYHDYIVEHFMPATGLADIVAFFLRRCFQLLRQDGAFGLIATNTVAQGDTRSTGLEAIVKSGGAIFRAIRRYQWPGEAAVVASVVQVAKTNRLLAVELDEKPIERISAFLLPGTGDSMPAVLRHNKGKCYLGTKIWGAGFVFETEPSDGSSSLADMARIIDADPRNRDVIVPYIGGEEFNTDPRQASSRFVIEFEERSEEEARAWPLLLSVVEERVKPVRATNKQRNYREEWWRHANRVPEAGAYAGVHGRLLAATSVSKHLSFAYAPRGTIVANSLVLMLLHACADFAILQSRSHEIWARFSGSSLEDRLRYTTPCFDTFPRPEPTPELEAAGQAYYDFRAALMVRNNQGLTATYNRFHDPDERDPDILRLRELHEAMDRAVLHAYGWDDIPTRCEFLLDWEEPDDEEETGRKKKKPWRYRWPDEVRDLVLARLLELNRVRAEEERLAKVTGDTPVKAPKKPAAKAPKPPARKPSEDADAPVPVTRGTVLPLFGPRKDA